MKTGNRDKILPTNFGDPYDLCDWLRPALVECNDLDDWVFLSTTELKRAVFSTSGWRLTRTGVELLSSVFQSYNTRNEENIQVTGKILLGMDRCCKSPWFLGGKMITVFNSHVHLEIQMVGGRMSDFIDFKMIKP